MQKSPVWSARAPKLTLFGLRALPPTDVERILFAFRGIDFHLKVGNNERSQFSSKSDLMAPASKGMVGTAEASRRGNGKDDTSDNEDSDDDSEDDRTRVNGKGRSRIRSGAAGRGKADSDDDEFDL